MSYDQGFIYSTVNSYINKSRFCYSYKPPGPIDNCCIPPICATNEYLGQISTLSMVVNNSTRLTERSLLLGSQQQFFQEQSYQQTNSIVQSTIANNASITSTLYGQLLQVKRDRYLPYQPYIPPVIPPSVIQLQMATVNTGVPHSFFTVADCKGVQSVTNSSPNSTNLPIVSGQVKWATYFSSTGNTIKGITTDNDDNVYIIGYFTDNITLYNYDSPPVNGNEIITSIYGTLSTNTNETYVYIIKYNNLGICQWATTLESEPLAYGYSIVTDSSNNVYVSGFYSNSQPLTINNFSSPPVNGGPVGLVIYGQLSNIGLNDVFIIKYNSSGLAQWGTTIGGIDSEINYSLVTDQFDNVYVAGTSKSNPLIINNYNSAPIGGGFVGLSLYGNIVEIGTNIFLIKYNSLGICQWATIINGTYDDQFGPSLSIDQTGNIYLAGSYTTNPITIKNFSNITFPTINTVTYGSLTNILDFDIFIVKYDSTGAAQWATNIGGIEKDINFSIASDTNGNISVTGYYKSNSLLINSFNITTLGIINVSPYGTLINNAPSRNSFVVNYDTNGQAKWATSILDNTESNGTSIATDISGNVYVSGYFFDKLSLYNFESNPNIVGGLVNLSLYGTTSCSGNRSIYLIKYNSSGKIQWMTTCITETLISNPVIKTTLSGYIYITGKFANNLQVNSFMYQPIQGGVIGLNQYGSITNSNTSNGYLIKYTQ